MEDRLIPRAMRQHSAADWSASLYVQALKRIHVPLPQPRLHAVSWRGNGWSCFVAEGGQRSTEPGALTRVAPLPCSLKQHAMRLRTERPHEGLGPRPAAKLTKRPRRVWLVMRRDEGLFSFPRRGERGVTNDR